MLQSLVLSLVLLAAPAAPAPVAFDVCTSPRPPEPDSIQTIQISRTAAVGSTLVTSANLYGQRSPSGAIRLLVRPTRPEELRGTFLSLTVRDDGTEILFGSPELDAPKRITGNEALGRLFQTDYSYQDFAYWQGFAKAMKKTRLADAQVAKRAVFVVELRPTNAADSAYERLVASFDQETCVPLRTEMYEPGDRLRKVQTIDPALVVWSETATRHLPQIIVLEDRREGSRTDVEIVSADFERPGEYTIFGKRP
jgi:hypothetical protein